MICQRLFRTKLVALGLLTITTNAVAQQQEAHVSWIPGYGSWTTSQGWGLDPDCGLYAINNGKLECDGDPVPRWFVTIPAPSGPSLDNLVVDLMGFTLHTNSSTTITNGGTLDIIEELTIGSTGNGSANIIGDGTGVLYNRADCEVLSSSRINLGAIENYGDWTYRPAAEHSGLEGGGTFFNHPGASLEFQGNASLAQNTGGPPRIYNHGRVAKTNGGVTFLNSVDFEQSSNGILEIDEGVFSIQGGSLVAAGDIEIGSSGELEIVSAANQLSVAGDVTCDGSIYVYVQSPLNVLGQFQNTGVTTIERGTVNFNNAPQSAILSVIGSGGNTHLTGSFTITDLFSWSGGTFHSSQITVSDSALIDQGTLDDSSLLVVPGATVEIELFGLHGDNASTVFNDGAVVLSNQAALNTTSGGAFFYNNSGATLLKTGIGSASNVSWTMFNEGQIHVQQGTINFFGSFTQFGPSSFTALEGGNISFSNSFLVDEGVFLGSGLIGSNAGTLEIADSAILSPGFDLGPGNTVPGTIVVDAHLLLQPNSQSHFKIGGTVQQDYDTVAAGSAQTFTVGGLLVPVMVNGFENSVQASDQFRIFDTHRPIAGEFDNASNGAWVKALDEDSRHVGWFRVHYGPDSPLEINDVILTDYRPRRNLWLNGNPQSVSPNGG